MTEERRKADRRVSPAVAEFALQERGELLARIAELEREVSEANSDFVRMANSFESVKSELEAVVAQKDERISIFESNLPGWSALRLELAALKAKIQAADFNADCDSDTVRADGYPLNWPDREVKS